MKPTLLVLAAGMGSRYGALKQMDGVGPNNEAILDYSIYDAKRAGFGDDERMRRAFLRHLGVSPTEYRNRFSGG
jgi:AraC-like DNA-binding protein